MEWISCLIDSIVRRPMVPDVYSTKLSPSGPRLFKRFALAAFIGTMQLLNANAGNRIDDFMAMCTSKGAHVVDSYQVDKGVVYIAMDSDFWGTMTKDQQLRLCNSIANIGLFEGIDASLAILTLDNGNTTVGQISPVWSGPRGQFTPNEEYWKYR